MSVKTLKKLSVLLLKMDMIKDYPHVKLVGISIMKSTQSTIQGLELLLGLKLNEQIL